MKTKKYEIKFVVEVREDALPADEDSAKADVIQLVEGIWDDGESEDDDKRPVVDSYNFEAEFIGRGEVDE